MTASFNQTKKLNMKTFSKIAIVSILVLYSTVSGAQQATRRFYNDDEIILPNFLQYDKDEMQETTIKGTLDKSVVTISWKTKAETNTSHFELQRSSDGIDYEPIETITASGISKNINRYATTDFKYSIGKSRLYYRVKIVFINGVEDFTDAVTVDVKTFSLAKTSALSLWKSSAK
jgi:hypothetical protein